MKNFIKLFCKEFDLNPREINQEKLYQQLEQLALSCPQEPSLLGNCISNDKEQKEYCPTSIHQSEIHIYSDGACSGSSHHGGWGAVICYPDGKVQQLSGAEPQTTNNRMELLAAIKALEHIEKEKPLSSITITTDSQYVKNGITQWIFNWRKNGWKTASKEPVKNKDLWQKLDNLNQTLQPKWQWVRGHNGNTYNEMCDDLAVKARISLE